ncbi:hypothetical protein SERLA73DRAFT_186993 [Serpula lacrymans var. lacrymans S7.3]|uniref:Uncharacterized protein n=2 Tax=Serpula lacrymans var. lacrymans TaxID=341189 RepID=F8Q887_SERL3|nr:uncharacterized protein SERLADRAFT_476316 [Serpula lacrymans var. lacrymans S7.9]EGN95775.1 hypothetical protein SERLA73DRAFT_186993 [Serpula lacrymans var. lacrymans S7.3]EGO21297.1 hypothetical protein SERLADRAFT_476316 [Serpula lacrymans var. lacrymans S7.9]
MNRTDWLVSARTLPSASNNPEPRRSALCHPINNKEPNKMQKMTQKFNHDLSGTIGNPLPLPSSSLLILPQED